MDKPKVSVITVVYNDCKHIEKTLQSVISQDFYSIEYVVIDGNSTDGTNELIQKYKNQIDIFVSESDKGIYDAMNKGLKRANGEYVIFMNSGDIFVDDKVLSHVFANSDKSADVIYGKTIGNHKGGKLLQELKPFFSSTAYCPRVGICHQSVFVRTSLAVRLLFDLDYKVCADHKMLYELHNEGVSFVEYNGLISEIICDEGFSDKHLKTKLIERGRIYGKEHTIHFKFFLYRTILKEKARSFIRLIEPSGLKKIRYKLKKCNYG